jgi:hypothetical protein
VNFKMEGFEPRTCATKQGVGDYISEAQSINSFICEHAWKLHHSLRMDETYDNIPRWLLPASCQALQTVSGIFTLVPVWKKRSRSIVGGSSIPMVSRVLRWNAGVP